MSRHRRGDTCDIATLILAMTRALASTFRLLVFRRINTATKDFILPINILQHFRWRYKTCRDLLDHPIMCHGTTSRIITYRRCGIAQLWITSLQISWIYVPDLPPTWTRHAFLQHHPCMRVIGFWLRQ